MTRDELGDRAAADEALAAAARAGDRGAFAELWRRHAPAGAVAARRFAHIADADDLLSEASLRIFAALRRGGGPHGPFRPYLYRAIRNVALDWRRPASVPLDDVAADELALPGPELAAAERTIGFRAFRSLPARWQSVLWYLDVEGMEPSDAAPLLGLSPNATSALAVRAREGLRRAWLQAHVNELGVPEGCRWTTDRMGEYARGGLTRRGRERFDAHLVGCDRCNELLAEVRDASGRLAVLLLPLLLGSAAAAELLARREAGPGGAGPAAVGPGGAGPTALAAARPALIAGGVVVAAVVVAAVALAAALPGGSDGPTAADPPRPVADPPTLAPTPEPTPAPPAPDPPPPAPPTRPVPPAPPPAPEPPAPPTPPAAPAAPTTIFDPGTGRLAAMGSGDVPGATIELLGTTTSTVTGEVSPQTLLASVVVAPDGSWTTPEASGLTPLQVTVVVRQVVAGVASDPVELVTAAFFGVTTTSTAASVAGGVASWELHGWGGATWEVREPGGGPAVAAGTFDASGTAIATLVLPLLPNGTVVSYDYGYVQDGALGASAPGLTATIP